MNFVYYEIVEDCIEAKNVYDAYLSIKIGNELMNHLSKLGKLVVMNNIEKPFFRIIVRGKYTLKAVMTDDKLRVLLPDIADFRVLDEIKYHINEFGKV
ncbi:hypothetical protein MASR1M45_01340 [Candidatus Kapaibacterium sp.]